MVISAHPLYMSWKAHKRRGLRPFDTFEEFLDEAVKQGWILDRGHRVEILQGGVGIFVNRRPRLQPEYGPWSRMHIFAVTRGLEVEHVWSDFYNFQVWCRGHLPAVDEKTSIQSLKHIQVGRWDKTKPFGPDNCHLYVG